MKTQVLKISTAVDCISSAGHHIILALRPHCNLKCASNLKTHFKSLNFKTRHTEWVLFSSDTAQMADLPYFHRTTEQLQIDCNLWQMSETGVSPVDSCRSCDVCDQCCAELCVVHTFQNKQTYKGFWPRSWHLTQNCYDKYTHLHIPLLKSFFLFICCIYCINVVYMLWFLSTFYLFEFLLILVYIDIYIVKRRAAICVSLLLKQWQ